LDIGASVAGDESALACGGMKGVRAIHTWRYQSTMQTVGEVIRIARQKYNITLSDGDVPICIDADGLGKGVADRLEENGCNVIHHHGGAGAEENQLYVNRRAEVYAELGRRLDPSGRWGEGHNPKTDEVFLKQPFALPNDSMLLADLVVPEKIFDSTGIRYKLTPKDRKPGMKFNGRTIREQLGRSPDRGDAVTMLYRAVRECLEEHGRIFVAAADLEADGSLDDVFDQVGW